MRILEDVQTLPIEINVQSAGVSQEEQIFYTNDDDETEEQYWARKEAIRKNPVIDEPAVTIQTLSTNLIKQQPEIQVRLRKTNQIIIEQSKDAVLQQLKAKLLHEDYSENVLQQDARYRHYASNLERISVKEEILTRQYLDETGNVKYHQTLLPQLLLQELLQSLHGTAHKHPGISKMLQEIRQRYYYPNMAKYVKKWVEGCEQCAKDKRVPNATITPELLSLPEWDLAPEDASQIDSAPFFAAYCCWGPLRKTDQQWWWSLQLPSAQRLLSAQRELSGMKTAVIIDLRPSKLVNTFPWIVIWRESSLPKGGSKKGEVRKLSIGTTIGYRTRDGRQVTL